MLECFGLRSRAGVSVACGYRSSEIIVYASLDLLNVPIFNLEEALHVFVPAHVRRRGMVVRLRV